jgi:predicted O-methyltransferase YrrM
MRRSITLDSTECKTDLCTICSELGTDKSPYSKGGAHRHPYTAPYSLFFEPLRHKPIKVAEFGVFRGASLMSWRCFFTHARIFGFDCDEPNLNFIREKLALPGVWVDKTDCATAEVLTSTFKQYTADGLFDVVIDDASHNMEHQALMIRTALPFIHQGGLLIIEDIFRDYSEEPLLKALEDVKDMISFHTFIMCEHKDRFSPGWNNDKMLVIVRA